MSTAKAPAAPSGRICEKSRQNAKFMFWVKNPTFRNIYFSNCFIELKYINVQLK